MSHHRELAFAAAATFGCSLALSGCTPELTGRIGVGVDGAGRPVAYVNACRDTLGLATLYLGAADDDLGPDFGQWTATPQVRGASSWALASPSEPWEAKHQLQNLVPGVVYELRATSKDEWSTAGVVYFRTEDLKLLRPGQVRVVDDRKVPNYPENAGFDVKAKALNEASTVIPVAEFNADC